MTLSDWIQLAAVLVALAASIIALVIATQDRRTQNYKTPEQLRERLDDPDEMRSPRWVKDKIESGLAVQAIMAEMYGTSGEELPVISADPDNPDEIDDGWPRESS